MIQTFAHISDLCIGRDGMEEAARRICVALCAARVDQVLVTGDITHRGLHDELRQFEAAFAPFIDEDRLVVVPGDRDRMGDDVGALVSGAGVSAGLHGGLYVVRADSTTAVGKESDADGVTVARIGEIETAFTTAPRDALSVLVLHHPPTRTPGAELAPLRLGGHLLERILGRCDLVLHGHFGAPSDIRLDGQTGRPLRTVGAGSTTELDCARVFAYDAGKLVAQRWLHADAAVVSRVATGVAPSEVDAGLGATESSGRVAA